MRLRAFVLAVGLVASGCDGCGKTELAATEVSGWSVRVVCEAEMRLAVGGGGVRGCELAWIAHVSRPDRTASFDVAGSRDDERDCSELEHRCSEPDVAIAHRVDGSDVVIAIAVGHDRLGAFLPATTAPFEWLGPLAGSTAEDALASVPSLDDALGGFLRGEREPPAEAWDALHGDRLERLRAPLLGAIRRGTPLPEPLLVRAVETIGDDALVALYDRVLRSEGEAEPAALASGAALVAAHASSAIEARLLEDLARCDLGCTPARASALFLVATRVPLESAVPHLEAWRDPPVADGRRPGAPPSVVLASANDGFTAWKRAIRALLEIHRTRTCSRVLEIFEERTEASTVFDPPPRPDDVAVQAFGGLDDVALDAASLLYLCDTPEVRDAMVRIARDEQRARAIRQIAVLWLVEVEDDDAPELASEEGPLDVRQRRRIEGRAPGRRARPAAR